MMNSCRTTPFEKTRARGFTLVETLIAIAILALAVVGPLYTAGRALIAAEISTQELTASYLAQEGVEAVRAMRDHEFLAFYAADSSTATSASWNDFLQGSGIGSVSKCVSTACAYDPGYTMQSGYSLTTCTGGTCPALYLASGIYTERTDLGGSATPYHRTVEIVPVAGASVDQNGNPTDVIVVSKVTWSFHGASYTVTANDHLTPWQ